MTPPPPAAASHQADQADRDRVYRQIGTTMFVEAGAGTGKTTALVNRVLELVTGPSAVPIGSIAAITFTEKAAAELRNRIRARLNELLAEQAVVQASETEQVSEALRSALDGLDSAAISTLHGFARRILSEHPVEARLPPRFEALDQIASDVEFDERWRRFISELLSDPGIGWAVDLVDAAGVQPDALRDIGEAFNANWDRVLAAGEPAQATPIDASSFIEHGASLLEWRHPTRDFSDAAGKLRHRLDGYVARLRAATTDIDRFAVLNESNLDGGGVPKGGNVFRGEDWAPMREGLAALRAQCGAAAIEAMDHAIAALCDRIAHCTLEAAEQRRAAGRLEFHDLLARSRDLLRASPQARASLHRKYRHLLLDEFQDTDPIQIEIAALIAAGEHGDAVGPAWDQLDTISGQLFFVGDPKQSIYRFRRADIELYDDAQRRFGHQIGETATLGVNYRSTVSIMAWVNAVFGSLMGDEAGDDITARRLQSPYSALTAARADIGRGPAVTALGIDAHDKQQSGLNAEGIRAVEAADVAGTIAEIVHDGWEVHDRHLDGARPARLSDIAILVPTRTCLPQLEAGLSAASVPYRLEASEFVWRSRTVRDLMMCLRAAADPDDALAVVSALRTPMYGCGDDDLYAYYRAVGSWSYFAPELEASQHGEHSRVATALVHLRALYEQHTLVAPSVLLERLVRERRVFEQAAAGPQTRDIWRHVRYVIDQARAWSESQHGGLRSFLRWVEMQSAERAKITEAILPESDDDSVRVMTVHASKGLQFPVVIVAGLQGNGAHPTSTRAIFVDDRSDGPPSSRYGGAEAVRLRKGAETLTYADLSDAERLADHHERVRLLYVACTRARDHLVVSLHREAPSKTGELFNRTHAQLIADALPERADRASAVGRWDYRSSSDPEAEPVELRRPDAANRQAERLDRASWRDRRDRAAALSSQRSALSATRVAHGAATDRPTYPRGSAEPEARGKDAPNDHLGGGRAPARRGRGATAVGKAVHGVLQSIDLLTGEGLESLAAAQAVSEGIAGRQGVIEAFVRSALASDEVQDAACERHWKEVYVAAPVDDTDALGSSPTVVEGFVDLMYEDPATGGLIVVDYKTDALGSMPDADSERAQQYRTQVATYAWCVERSTGRRVGRVVLLYLRADGTPAVPDVLEGEALRRVVGAVPSRTLDVLTSP